MPATAPPRLDAVSLERARRVLSRRDPALRAVIRRAGPCALVPRGDPYRMLLRSVVFQQLAGNAARAIDRRFRAPHRGRYPMPAVLLATPETELRAAGLSRQKIAALRAVAEAFARRELDNRRLRRLDDEAVIESVTRVRGIGVWTAQMLLIFTLGRPDILPTGDFGVRKGAMRLYGLPELPKPRALEALAEPWRPWRSVAAWYLWRAADTLPPRPD